MQNKYKIHALEQQCKQQILQTIHFNHHTALTSLHVYTTQSMPEADSKLLNGVIKFEHTVQNNFSTSTHNIARVFQQNFNLVTQPKPCILKRCLKTN